MKLNSHDQALVNSFFRNFVNGSYKNPMNTVRLNKEHTDEHRRQIFEVCNYLLTQGIPFWTEVRLNCGCIPDIVCPTHVKPIVEVLCTETPDMFKRLKLPKYPPELHKSFIFVNAKVPFEERFLW